MVLHIVLTFFLLNYLVSWLFTDNKGTRILYWLCSDPPSKNKNSSCNFFTPCLFHLLNDIVLKLQSCGTRPSKIKIACILFFFCYSLISPSLQCDLNILFVALLNFDSRLSFCVCFCCLWMQCFLFSDSDTGKKARLGQKVHGEQWFHIFPCDSGIWWDPVCRSSFFLLAYPFILFIQFLVQQSWVS